MIVSPPIPAMTTDDFFDLAIGNVPFGQYQVNDKAYNLSLIHILGRYVRRGSKGIALVDDSGDRPRLRYVFDSSDTGTGEHSRTPWLWQLEERYLDSVQAMLERTYDVSGEDLAGQLTEVAGKLAEEYPTAGGRSARRHSVQVEGDRRNHHGASREAGRSVAARSRTGRADASDRRPCLLYTSIVTWLSSPIRR